MEIAFFLVALVVVVLAGTATADRIGVPAPLLLIAVGVGGTFLPFVPEVHLEPHIVLLGLLPPLLYAAAIQTSLVDFNANRRPILFLSVGLVAFTAFGVGALVHLIVPSIPWHIAIAIGAVVAPPDAVAATAIARSIGLPRRVVTILEGESLLNDATALVALRTALAATAGVHALEVGGDFLWASLGGAALGFVVFVIVAKLRKLVTDPLMDTAISLVTPFAAYLLAEELKSSGVIAVVVAGLLLGHKAPVLQTAQSRIAERINWRTIAFLLENTVFLLIGLQARWILEGVADSELSTGRIAAVCLATLLATIVLRLVWVFAARTWLTRASGGVSASQEVATWQDTFVLGWAGMRGVVTLAAAFIIEEDVHHREVLLLIAFTVVAGSLFIQGLSLPWVARRLRVPSPDPLEDALARAALLQQASKAGFAALDELEHDDPHGVRDLIHQRVDQRNFAAWEQLSTTPGQESPSELYARIRLAMIDAERAKVLEIRSTGAVASEVVRQVLSTLDVEESMLDLASSEDDTDAPRAIRIQTGDSCEHLDEAGSAPMASAEDGLSCHECVELGAHWVSLRRCLACGNVACCDSSPYKHATAHFHDSTHPVMQSAQPGEDWRWCFVHHLTG